MAKLPWFAFYPTDWLHDTRRLTPATRGIWIDILATLWPHGSQTMNVENWLRSLSISQSEWDQAIEELRMFNICNVGLCNGAVTLVSRRMLREKSKRESTASRVQRYRVTQMKRDGNALCNGQILDTRDQKLETIVLDAKKEKKLQEARSVPKKPPASPVSDAEWLLSLKANPAYHGIDIDLQISKLEAWLSTRPGLKKTRRRIVNWLNRVDKPMIPSKPGWRTT